MHLFWKDTEAAKTPSGITSNKHSVLQANGRMAVGLVGGRWKKKLSHQIINDYGTTWNGWLSCHSHRPVQTNINIIKTFAFANTHKPTSSHIGQINRNEEWKWQAYGHRLHAYACAIQLEAISSMYSYSYVALVFCCVRLSRNWGGMSAQIPECKHS